MKKINKWASLVALTIFIITGLTSCASVKNKAALKPVYVTNTKKIRLLATDNISNTIDQVQLLKGKFGDTSFSLLSYTQIDSQQISLSLFTDFGNDMGSLYYDGNSVILDSAFVPEKLPGEYIVADIQNAFYDFEVLKENYLKAGLTFEANEEVQRGADGRETSYIVRRVYDGKKLIEEITILNNTITIKNFLRGYEYQLIRAEE